MNMRTIAGMAALLAAGCGSKDTKDPGPGGGGVASFTLKAAAFDGPGSTVTVSAKVPASWKTTIDEKDGSPEFELPGDTSFMKPTLVFLTPAGDDDAARMKTTIRLQYDEADQAAARREELSGGRVWIAHTRDNGYVHARLFIPAPAQQGVVMCVAMLEGELAAKLPEIRAMCESVAIGG